MHLVPHPILLSIISLMFLEGWWWCVAHLFCFFCCPIMCMCPYVLSSVMWCPLRFPDKKQCSVWLYLQVFVGDSMYYLRYLCSFAYSYVRYILCCGFRLFFFVLWNICSQFLWIVHLIAPSVFSNVYFLINFQPGTEQ